MRLISLLLVSLGLLLFAACEPDDSPPTATPSLAPPTSAPGEPTSAPGEPSEPTSVPTVPSEPMPTLPQPTNGAGTPSPTLEKPTAVALISTPTPPSTPTPECLQPAPPEPPMPAEVRITSNVGVSTALHARALFDLSENDRTFQWQQVFGEPSDLEYLTSHRAELMDASSELAAFVPEAAGNYRFRLTAADAGGVETHHVDVQVTQEVETTWDVKGAIFADLWGPLGGPAFNSAPEDSECLAKVLDHAYEGPLRVGAGWVAFVPANFIVQVTPTPVLRPEGNYHSLTDDDYYATLIAAAHDRGLKVVQFEQDSPHFELSPEEMSALETMQSSSAEWWEAWFDQWKEWVVQRAARAEAVGVEMFVPYLMADGTFRPEAYPDYDKRWREILTAIREVYSGTLAMSFVNADERLTFIDAFDVAFVTVFPAMYTSMDTIADKQSPTLDEAIQVNEFFLSFPQPLIQADKPIYYILTINSSDGQTGSEDIEEKSTFVGDFQEQALYYEAFFQVASELPYIKGVFTERWDWFDQYHRPADTPEAIYFDATLESSPRSKPAEEVVKLWFEIH